MKAEVDKQAATISLYFEHRDTETQRIILDKDFLNAKVAKTQRRIIFFEQGNI